jgi:hypothetical protein
MAGQCTEYSVPVFAIPLRTWKFAQMSESLVDRKNAFFPNFLVRKESPHDRSKGRSYNKPALRIIPRKCPTVVESPDRVPVRSKEMKVSRFAPFRLVGVGSTSWAIGWNIEFAASVMSPRDGAPASMAGSPTNVTCQGCRLFCNWAAHTPCRTAVSWLIARWQGLSYPESVKC